MRISFMIFNNLCLLFVLYLSQVSAFVQAAPLEERFDKLCNDFRNGVNYSIQKDQSGYILDHDRGFKAEIRAARLGDGADYHVFPYMDDFVVKISGEFREKDPQLGVLYSEVKTRQRFLPNSIMPSCNVRVPVKNSTGRERHVVFQPRAAFELYHYVNNRDSLNSLTAEQKKNMLDSLTTIYTDLEQQKDMSIGDLRFVNFLVLSDGRVKIGDSRRATDKSKYSKESLQSSKMQIIFQDVALGLGLDYIPNNEIRNVKSKNYASIHNALKLDFPDMFDANSELDPSNTKSILNLDDYQIFRIMIKRFGFILKDNKIIDPNQPDAATPMTPNNTSVAPEVSVVKGKALCFSCALKFFCRNK